MIVENDRCVVPDEDFRSGKRARQADDSPDKASVKRKRHRKKGAELNFDIHEDTIQCYEALIQSSGVDELCKNNIIDDDHAAAVNVVMRMSS